MVLGLSTPASARASGWAGSAKHYCMQEHQQDTGRKRASSSLLPSCLTCTRTNSTSSSTCCTPLPVPAAAAVADSRALLLAGPALLAAASVGLPPPGLWLTEVPMLLKLSCLRGPFVDLSPASLSETPPGEPPSLLVGLSWPLASTAEPPPAAAAAAAASSCCWAATRFWRAASSCCSSRVSSAHTTSAGAWAAYVHKFD